MSEQKVLCACGCGAEIPAFDRRGIRRRFVIGHTMRGKRLSAEARSQISANLRGRPVSPQTRAKMAAALRGQRSPRWKGGRLIDKDGYVRILIPDHRRADAKGYVYEHVFAWETVHGPVPTGFCLHHKNGDKQDNRLENLQMMTNGEHMKLHNRKAKNNA